jgi:hypothetical protein
MLEVEALKFFFSFLNVPPLLKHHLSDSTKWVMAKCMHKQVLKKKLKIITSSKYLALSCDEVTMIDNQ